MTRPRNGANMEITDTRGPWSLDEDRAGNDFVISDRDGAVVATVLGDADDPAADEEARAKAVVATLAPEMHDLLTDVGRWLEAGLTRGEISRGTANRDGDLVSQIRALLARADRTPGPKVRAVPASEITPARGLRARDYIQTNPHPDFFVRSEGTVWVFTPNTPEALTFAQTEMGLESWQWFGNGFAIEHRIAPDLKLRLESEGRSVEWEPDPPTHTNAKRNAQKKPGRR